MPSATDHPAASSGAPQRNRPPGLALPGWLGLAALLSVLLLALAGPAAAATRSGGPNPDPSPSTTGSGGPSPDPVPQATGVGSVISQGSQGTGSASHSSGTSGSPAPVVQVPATLPPAPAVSHPPASTGSTSATRATTAAAKSPAHPRKPHHHPVAHLTAAQRPAALAYQRLRHQLALESRTASPISAAVATITAAPTHNNGTVLLIGAGVLLVLAAAGGALLRRLWRLHGEWYGGKPA